MIDGPELTEDMAAYPSLDASWKVMSVTTKPPDGHLKGPWTSIRAAALALGNGQHQEGPVLLYCALDDQDTSAVYIELPAIDKKASVALFACGLSPTEVNGMNVDEGYHKMLHRNGLARLAFRPCC